MKLKEAIALLAESGIDSAEYDARELFRKHTTPSQQGYVSREAECSSPLFEEDVKRRCEREPLQYILGKVGFWREEYTVTPAVLIPRPDTEHLVEYAVKHIPCGERFLDVCTGSGCVAISTLKSTVGTTAAAIDLSADALAVARLNAENMGVLDRLSLREEDALRHAPDGSGPYFAILSNPPYVTDSEYLELEPEIYKEPKMAFVGGADGGDFYRAIVGAGKSMIKPEGFIALEIGAYQRPLLTALAKEHGFSIEIIKDYSGHDRVAVLKPILR